MWLQTIDKTIIVWFILLFSRSIALCSLRHYYQVSNAIGRRRTISSPCFTIPVVMISRRVMISFKRNIQHMSLLRKHVRLLAITSRITWPHTIWKNYWSITTYVSKNPTFAICLITCWLLPVVNTPCTWPMILHSSVTLNCQRMTLHSLNRIRI